jgi:hypothetical protein
MKNLKISLFTIMITIAAAACSGNHSTNVPDSTRSSTSPSVQNGGKADSVSGTNGAPNAIDSGMDNSSSGGTDSIKQGRKRKEFDR